jgi:preprotein translocase subunit SecA
MQKLGMEEGVPIEHGMVTRAIERAQKQVEGQNFSVRKHLLEYDDVMNKQRENIYALRREVLEGRIRLGEAEEDIVGTREYLMTLAEEILDTIVETYAPRDGDYEQWDLDALKQEVQRIFAADAGPLDFSDRTADEIRAMLWEKILASYEEKEQLVGREILQRIERDIMLQIVDQQWKDHLYSLDHLKEGIGLRGYGQRDPLVEYKKESFQMFQAMKERIDEEIVRYLWWLRPIVNEAGELPPPRQVRRPKPALILSGGGDEAPPAFGGPAQAVAAAPMGRSQQPARVGGDDAPVHTVRRDEPKVGRNDPCPCGSGKKYKKCHGAAA